MRWLFLLLLSFPLAAAENPLKKCLSGNGCFEKADKYLEKKSNLFLFVSFSMSDQALLYFSKELERYDGIFVLRGIPENSFPKLFQKLNHLTSMGIYVPFSIDPDLFEKHVSKVVPVLVLTEEKKVDRLVGNLSIRDSLGRFSFSGENKLLAKQKLKGGRDD